MVDIVVTISPLLERNELNVAVDQCTTSGIKKIRINVAKIFDEESVVGQYPLCKKTN